MHSICNTGIVVLYPLKHRNNSPLRKSTQSNHGPVANVGIFILQTYNQVLNASRVPKFNQSLHRAPAHKILFVL